MRGCYTLTQLASSMGITRDRLVCAIRKHKGFPLRKCGRISVVSPGALNDWLLTLEGQEFYIYISNKRKKKNKKVQEDIGMDMNTYQELARRTQNQALSLSDKRQHALYGLSSEVGEIHGIYQKFFQGHAVEQERLIGEVGDLLWFVAELCDVLGVSMGDVAAYNIGKLRRRYPEGFAVEKSVHRSEEV